MAREPAYQRLTVDERRRRLLALGAELFTRHAYDELTMDEIAAAAGITKATLYHYFPSKQAYFVATVQSAVAGVQAAIAADSDLPPAEQLERTLDAYLSWIDENATAYSKLLRSSHVSADVRALTESVRRETTERIVDGLAPGGPTAALRTAVAGWLWSIDGACLDWIEHRDSDREQLKQVLLGSLYGAIAAAYPPGPVLK